MTETEKTAAARVALNSLQPRPGARRRPKRLGCGSGSGHGQTSTRGQKGQRSRSGDGKLLGFEGGQTQLFRRIPKRGFRNAPFRTRFQIVALSDIERVFGNQKEVTLDSLRMHRLVQGGDPVKVLGGEIKHPLKVQAHAFSKSAKAKIEKAGGAAEVLPL